jgi:hypothetical protein
MMIFCCDNGSKVVWGWIVIIDFVLLVIRFIVGCILFNFFRLIFLLLNVDNMVLGLGMLFIIC